MHVVFNNKPTESESRYDEGREDNKKKSGNPQARVERPASRFNGEL